MSENKLIFIAEDDVMVLDVYQHVFTNHGYTVISAKDGEEAIAMLGKGDMHPALILLDIMMPKVSGFEVLKFIKTKPEIADIPVMFVTNLQSPEHIKEGLALGAAKFLIKSENNPQQIVNVINALLAAKVKPE